MNEKNSHTSSVFFKVIFFLSPVFSDQCDFKQMQMCFNVRLSQLSLVNVGHCGNYQKYVTEVDT